MVETYPAGRRRPHTKSRTGCAECRRRRVKCGEERPRCRHCLRRDIKCVYPSTSNKTIVIRPVQDSSSTAAEAATPTRPRSPASASASHSPFPGAGDRARAIPEFTIEDMALFHHWILSTSRSMTESPGVDRYWQTVFPQIGFRHSFVMHGILSLASLHRAHLYPGNRIQLSVEAARYHNQSLCGFRRGLSQMNDDNCDALFACASLNVVYVFGIHGRLHDDIEDDPNPTARKSRILGAEWIPMVRGVEAVLHPVYDRVRLGPLQAMLSLGNWDELEPDTSLVAEDDRFRSLGSIWAEYGDSEIYDKTLYLLRKCFAYMKQFEAMDAEALQNMSYNRTLSGPLIWMHVTPDEFFVRLHQRQPPALVIFAFFGVMLHRLNEYWFFQGWGRNIVGVVDELLGDYWRPWTDWPTRVVGLP